MLGNKDGDAVAILSNRNKKNKHYDRDIYDNKKEFGRATSTTSLSAPNIKRNKKKQRERNQEDNVRINIGNLKTFLIGQVVLFVFMIAVILASIVQPITDPQHYAFRRVHAETTEPGEDVLTTKDFSRTTLRFPCSSSNNNNNNNNNSPNGKDNRGRDSQQWCEAWLYLPSSKEEKHGIVILANGFAMQKDFGVRRLAEALASRGLASFTFDYRYFGNSDGEPRNLVRTEDQLQDLQSAIEFIRSSSEIADQYQNILDAERIGLWGYGISGGYVVDAASRNQKTIKAIAVQQPIFDGASCFAEMDMADVLSILYFGLRDLVRSFVGVAPAYTPIVSPTSGSHSGSNSEFYTEFMDAIPSNPQGGWQNKIPARSLLSLPFSYNVMASAGNVTCPVLVIADEAAGGDYLINNRVREAIALMRGAAASSSTTATATANKVRDLNLPLLRSAAARGTLYQCVTSTDALLASEEFATSVIEPIAKFFEAHLLGGSSARRQ